MIDVRTPVTPRAAARRRWWVPFLVVLVVAFGAGALLGSHRGGRSLAAALPAPSEVAATVPPSAPAPMPSATVSADVLQLSGRVPARGSGKFVYAPGTGPVLGRKGGIKRFHVAVERGSGEDVSAFTELVEATLGDTRSWVGAGQFRLQRVSPAVPVDFTVFLATRYAAGKMCERGGTNITIGSVPYTSCRTSGRAIINLDRWRRSAPTYVHARVPLSVYRQYVINHEVGHELGHHHEGCPQRGGPAPVMVQQTLTLRGCSPNAWPRVRGRQLSGPSL